MTKHSYFGKLSLFKKKKDYLSEQEIKVGVEGFHVFLAGVRNKTQHQSQESNPVFLTQGSSIFTGMLTATSHTWLNKKIFCHFCLSFSFF